MDGLQESAGETGGDVHKAIDYLRHRRLGRRRKKSGPRSTDAPLPPMCIPAGKIGVLVEINCETDFSCATAEFQSLLKDVAMQVAAAILVTSAREYRPRRSKRNR